MLYNLEGSEEVVKILVQSYNNNKKAPWEIRYGEGKLVVTEVRDRFYPKLQYH